jgi:hypothetical protein
VVSSDDAEAGAEVAAGHRHGVDGFLAEFVRDLSHLLDLELAKIVGRADGIEKRRLLNVVTAIFQFCMSGRNGPTRDGKRVNRAVKIQMPVPDGQGGI